MLTNYQIFLKIKEKKILNCLLFHRIAEEKIANFD